MRFALRLSVLIALCSWLCCGTMAQEIAGSIAGTVRDPQGAVVPNATVTITETDKDVVIRTLKTTGGGDFSAPLLPVGHYSLTVEAAGFQKYVQTGITLNANDKLTFFPTLGVGTTSQTVEVQATATQVELQSAQEAGLVNGTQLRELALNNRNYEQMVLLMPGTSDSGNSDQFFVGATAPFGTNSPTFAMNGGRREENNWLVDGTDNVDRGSNLTLLSFPSIDSIAELRVVRGAYDPELGRSASGQVDVITRSGTSSLHGGVYEFFRNNALNANSYFNKHFTTLTPRPILRYNDFGGTFGGPVWIPKLYEQKNKTFFFVSEEARRVVTYSNPTGTVPYTSMLSGQFQHVVCNSYTAAGVCNGFGTSIPTASINPIAQAYVTDIYSKYVPAPNATSAFNPFGFNGSVRGIYNFREDMVKIDHIFSQKLTVSGKINRDSIPTREAGGLFTSLPFDNVGTTETNAPGHNYTLRATIALSPTLLIEPGYGYSYGAILSNVTGAMNFSQSPDIQKAVNNLPFTNLLGRAPAVCFGTCSVTSGLGTELSTFGPYRDFNRNHTAFGNATKVSGAHTIKFGAIYYHYNKSENQLTGSNNGSYTFTASGAPTAGTNCTGDPTKSTTATCPFGFEQAFANFLLGQVGTFSQASQDVTADVLDNQFEYYAQDTWRLKPTLTITYGFRHSFFRQPTDATGELSNFDPALWNPQQAPCMVGTGSTAGNIDVKLVNGVPTTSACNPNYNPMNGFIYSNPPTFNGIKGTKSPFGDKVGSEYDRGIAPRFGIAWDPFGKGTTSIRSGFGMFYDNGFEYGNAELNVGLNPGFLTNLNINSTTLGNPTGVTTTVNTTGAPTINARVPLNYKSPYTEQWSLDVQQQLANKWLVDIGYYGNNGIHLPGYIDANQPAVDAYLNCLNGCASGPNTVKTTQPVNSTASSNLLNVVRPYLGYGPGYFFEDIYTSNYHSLQTQLQKQFGGNSLINIAYTWSHGLTTDPADRSTGASAIPQVTSDLRNNYGPTIADRRHVLTANFVWGIPWLKQQEGVVGHVLGGWEFSGVQTFQTGLPLTAGEGNGTCVGSGAACVDPTGSGCLLSTAQCGVRPNQVGDPNSGAAHNYDTGWFNAAAFQGAAPTQITETTERPGSIRAPGFWRTDLSLFKNIKFTERFTSQFRLESFNTFNHTNPICCGSTTMTSTLYNLVRSTRDPRIVQLAVKFNF
jgi:hypothetical protein